jgi:hypothetical protein
MRMPFDTLDVYSKDFEFRQSIATVQSATFTPRHLAQPSAQLVLPDDLSVNEFMLEDGARVICRYKGEHLMSGMLRSTSGQLAAGGLITYQLQDDYRWLTNTRAWVRPGSPLAPTSLTAGTDATLGQAVQTGAAGGNGTTKGQAGYMSWPSSVRTTETAVKHLLALNFARLGRPYIPTPDLGRGGDARAAGMLPQVRMDTLLEYVQPLLEWAGLGIRLWQEPREVGVRADVYEPKLFPQTLTYESGIVDNGTWTTKAPSVTRIITMGPGELAARAFREVRDTALEQRFGDIIESTTEATGGDALKWPDGLAEDLKVAKYYLLRSDISAELKKAFTDVLDAAGNKALAAGVPTSGVQAPLIETDAFHYGGTDGFHQGDRVKISRGTLSFEDRITECSLTLNTADGLVVKPTVGEVNDSPNRTLARSIVKLARAASAQATSR